ncbi:MAG: type II secretion system F family protein [Raoultibacter sp.]
MSALVVLACACAAISAASLFWFWQEGSAQRTRRKQLHTIALGGWKLRDGGSIESRGLSARVIDFMQAETQKQAVGQPSSAPDHTALRRSSARNQQMIRCAGLVDAVTLAGLRVTRRKLGVAALVLGGIVGLSLSNELGCVLGVCGLAWGYSAPARALKQEGALRVAGLESHLSEMIEVVSLGLRSGLSFDNAFQLYHTHFKTGLGAAAALAQQRWVMGLSTREEALRALAGQYDSALFTRVIENIIRSLRFGSSLAQSLEVTSVEARAVYKARREEAVAKAPIKMMIPTGTLILPAMLLLVLGPVLLDMMQGF